MGSNIRKTVLLFFAIGLIWSLTQNIVEYTKKLAFYEGYKTEYKKQAKKQAELKSELAKSDDYNLVERDIREKLNLLKEDEVAYILPKQSITPTLTPTPIKSPATQWIELFVE